MTEEQFDPDSLADHLDELFNSTNLPEGAEDPLVDAALKLSNAPKPTLSPEAFARIRGEVLEAASAASVAASTSTAGLFSGTTLVVAGTIAAVIIAVIVGIVVTNDDDPAEVAVSITPPAAVTAEPTEDTPDIILPEITPEMTEEATEVISAPFVEQTPEVTDEPTETPEPTETDEPTATDEPTETPEPTETDTLTPTDEPTATDEPTPMPINLVIEGPIDSIEDNIVIIFDFIIELDPDDPLLDVLEEGDTLRIDGDIADNEDGFIVILPIEVIPVEDDIAFNEDTGEVWRDDGTCNNPPPAWAPAFGWRARCESPPAQDDDDGVSSNPGDVPPSQGGNPPGQGDDNPGNGGNPPGQPPINPPGQDDDDDDCPGNSCQAPGQNPNNPPPGQGGNPPGQGNDDDD